jgi:hypothetical protein
MQMVIAKERRKRREGLEIVGEFETLESFNIQKNRENT